MKQKIILLFLLFVSVALMAETSLIIKPKMGDEQSEKLSQIGYLKFKEGSLLVYSQDHVLLSITVISDVRHLRFGEWAPDTTFIHNGENSDLDDLDEDGDGSVQTVVVQPGGQLNVNLSDIRLGALIVVADGLQSGQIHGGAGLHADHIYLDYILNPFGTKASPNRWYAFAVPFDVEIDGGITRICDNRELESGTDFLILEYQGLLRAMYGKGWEKKLSGTLEPGHFYMLGIDGTCNRWRFEKKAGRPFEGDTHIAFSGYGAGEYNPLDIGWNALGNTRLEYSDLTNISLSDLLYMVTYDNRHGKYGTQLINDMNLFVGQPFFIQANSSGFFDFHYNGPFLMPALRAPKAPIQLMHFTLADEREDASVDNLYITLHNEAAQTYTVGRDVARMSTDCKTAAQLWCLSAEGNQLTAHGIAEPQTETVVPLGLFAPTKGEYLFALETNQTDEYEAEIRYQGTFVATLFEGQTVSLNLNAGDNTEYSLLIRRKAPNGLDDVSAMFGGARKVLIDDHLYILSGERIYDAQGKKVK